MHYIRNIRGEETNIMLIFSVKHDILKRVRRECMEKKMTVKVCYIQYTTDV